MIDGFYSGYMTSSSGHGVVLFVLKAGKIVGADVGGVQFNGDYVLSPTGEKYVGKVKVSVPPNTSLIQGINSGMGGLLYEVPIEFPIDFFSKPFISLATPLGAVNLRLEKIRDMGGLE